MIEKVIELENISLIDFLGPENQNIARIATAYPESKIVSRGNELRLIGNKKDVELLNEFIQLLLEHYNRYGALTPEHLEDYLKSNKRTTIDFGTDGVVLFGSKGLTIKPKSKNQKELVNTISKKDLTFAIGPAGTGKTYLAVAMAVQALKSKQVRKIIITRPAVEAGENLGFLPGNLEDKVDPYLRPIYDALEEMIPSEKLNNYKENNIIEIAPLAYMRGRTLNNAFVLLDEAQNTTSMQMKMFLTRLGTESKMVITGDASQIDLPGRQTSGLLYAKKALEGINDIGFVYLDGKDVVRHSIVQKVIQAFEKFDNE